MAAAAPGSGAAKSAGPVYDKEGTLTKLGQKVKSWKTRVFALSKIKKTIYYFQNDEHFATHKKDKVRNFLGTINLQNASLYIADYMDAPICFELSTPARNYFINCKTKDEMADWVSEIASCGVRVKMPYRNTNPEYSCVFAKHGFMDKRGLYVTGFKTRFFRTVENAGGKMVLAYYANVEDMEPKGVIPLTGIEIHDMEGTEEFKMKVPGQERMWHFRCKPKEDTERPDKGVVPPGQNPHAKPDPTERKGGKTDKRVWIDVFNAIAKGEYEWNPPEPAVAPGAGAEGQPSGAAAVNPNTRELYDVLGVAPTATPEEIVKAYRAAAKRLHPDANRADPHAKEKFQNLLSAYHALMDKEARAKYDADGDSQAVGVAPGAAAVVVAGAGAAAGTRVSVAGQPAAAANGAGGAPAPAVDPNAPTVASVNGSAPVTPANAGDLAPLPTPAERERQATLALGRPETADEKAARLQREKIEEARRAKLAMYGTGKNPKTTLVDIIQSKKDDEALKTHREHERAREDKEREEREARYRKAEAEGRLNPASPAPAPAPVPGSPAPSNDAAAPSTPATGASPAAGASPSVNGAPSPAPAGTAPATPVPAATAAGAEGKSPASASASASVATSAADALAADRKALADGVEMIKIPKWGDHVKRKYYLVEVKRVEKGKADSTEWAIKWESKGKKAADTTFFITGCTLYKGHQKGYFKDKSNQKLYAAEQSFTLFSKQREMDMYCCNAADMAKWIAVLTPLVQAVADAPNSSSHNGAAKK